MIQLHHFHPFHHFAHSFKYFILYIFYIGSNVKVVQLVQPTGILSHNILLLKNIFMHHFSKLVHNLSQPQRGFIPCHVTVIFRGSSLGVKNARFHGARGLGERAVKILFHIASHRRFFSRFIHSGYQHALLRHKI